MSNDFVKFHRKLFADFMPCYKLSNKLGEIDTKISDVVTRISDTPKNPIVFDVRELDELDKSRSAVMYERSNLVCFQTFQPEHKHKKHIDYIIQNNNKLN